MDRINVGLIGILKHASEEEFWQSMTRLAQLGYRGVEGAESLLNGDAASNVKRFEDLGLKALTISAGVQQLRDSLPELIRNAHTLHSPRVSVWWTSCESREIVLADIDVLNRAGAALAAEGIKLCYHNHEHEFRKVFDGTSAMDLLIAQTDPKSVFFELDIAWTAFGGADPVRLIHQLAGRIPALHVKDLYDLSIRDRFTAVGTGLVPVRQSVQAAIDTGIEWAVVEQDKLRNLSAWDTITTSYLYLKENGLAV